MEWLIWPKGKKNDSRYYPICFGLIVKRFVHWLVLINIFYVEIYCSVIQNRYLTIEFESAGKYWKHIYYILVCLRIKKVIAYTFSFIVFEQIKFNDEW